MRFQRFKYPIGSLASASFSWHTALGQTAGDQPGLLASMVEGDDDVMEVEDKARPLRIEIGGRCERFQMMGEFIGDIADRAALKRR